MKAKFRNINYIVALLIGILFVAVSCSDSFFDQQAGNRMNPDNHYQSMKDIEVSLEGVLAPLQDLMPKVIIADGLRSDLMTVTDNFDANLQDVLNHNYSANNPYLDGSGFYKIIISVNEIIAHIDDVATADPNFDEYFYKYTKGALLSMRAWAYFNIVKLYGEAALITDNLSGVSGSLKQEFLGKQAMIDTLINQLLPYVHSDLKVVELYIPKYVNTKTLIGELYLEQNNYAKAIEFLKLGLESYSNGKKATTLEKGEASGMDYKVDKTFQKENWKNIFINSENGSQENIGVIPFSSKQGQWNPLTKMMNHYDLYLVKPTQNIVDLFDAQPNLAKKIGDVNRGKGISFDTIPNTYDYYISKYSLDVGEPYSADIVFSRVADLHLLLAEALNRNGDSFTAMVLLNQGVNAEKTKPKGYTAWAGNLGIRGRAYLQTITVPVEITDDTEKMLYVEDLIIQERAMELAFEGKRFTDLVRIAERRGDPSYVANRVSAKFADEGKRNEIWSKMSNSANWYLPTIKAK